MIKNLDQGAAHELLKDSRFGHLGVVLETGDPYIVPINYIYTDGSVYLHSLPGAKLDALCSNGRVCLQVERIESDLRWQSVIAFGEFQEINKTNEKVKVLHEFKERFERLTPVEALNVKNWNSGGAVVYRINITRITGMAEE